MKVRRRKRGVVVEAPACRGCPGASVPAPARSHPGGRCSHSLRVGPLCTAPCNESRAERGTTRFLPMAVR